MSGIILGVVSEVLWGHCGHGLPLCPGPVWRTLSGSMIVTTKGQVPGLGYLPRNILILEGCAELAPPLTWVLWIAGSGIQALASSALRRVPLSPVVGVAGELAQG